MVRFEGFKSRTRIRSRSFVIRSLSTKERRKTFARHHISSTVNAAGGCFILRSERPPSVAGPSDSWESTYQAMHHLFLVGPMPDAGCRKKSPQKHFYASPHDPP